MTTTDLLLSALDPQLSAVAAALPALQLEGEGLAATRAALAQAYRLPEPCSDDAVTVRPAIVPRSAAPGVPVLIYEPRVAAAARRPVVIDIHGGGFVLGSAAMDDPQNRALARDLGAIVVSIDYRLAPEHAYPCAIEDCHAVALHVFDSADAWRADAQRVALLGASAGGGLAAALALRMRDRGDPPLCGQVLLSPMLDDRTGLSEAHRRQPRIGWSAHNNQIGWRALLGTAPGAADTHCHAAPARAQTLEALPPTFVSVGALDLFLDEDIAFARRLAGSGVPVELHVYPGAFHGFARFAPEAAVSRRSSADAAAALKRMLSRST